MNRADDHRTGSHTVAVTTGRAQAALPAQLVEEYAPLPNNDADEVARELQRARGKGLFSGWFLIWRLRYEAWLEERLRQEIARKLATRAELARCHNQAVVAQNELRNSLLVGQSAERQRHADASLVSVPTQTVDIGEGETIRVPMPEGMSGGQWDAPRRTPDDYDHSEPGYAAYHP